MQVSNTIPYICKQQARLELMTSDKPLRNMVPDGQHQCHCPPSRMYPEECEILRAPSSARISVIITDQQVSTGIQTKSTDLQLLSPTVYCHAVF